MRLLRHIAWLICHCHQLRVGHIRDSKIYINGSCFLQVHSIIFAASGTLLLCSIDPSGVLNRIRAKLREAFPGRPTKQTSIAHSTLLRVLTPQQLPTEASAALQVICQKYTASLRGIRISVDCLWYIIEEVFSTIEGPQQDCLLQAGLPEVR